MATNLVRYELDGSPHWGVASASGIAPLDGAYPTTAALIEHGEADWRRASARAPSVSFDSALILSPVTTPCRIYCQGANYRQHMIESGMDPDAKAFSVFGRSAAGRPPPAPDDRAGSGRDAAAVHQCS